MMLMALCRWWNECYKNARCQKDQIFGSIHVSRVEGWNPQQGENCLDSMVAESDSTETEPPVQSAPTRSESSTLSKSTRKRRREQAVADAIASSSTSRDAILLRKNQLLEEDPDYICNVMVAIEVLNALPDVKMWSPLYKAPMDHLMEDLVYRQAFLVMKDDENKTFYLEYKTGKNRDY